MILDYAVEKGAIVISKDNYRDMFQVGYFFRCFIADWLINESMNQWINESMNQWIKESMNQWINESMNQWINEW